MTSRGDRVERIAPWLAGAFLAGPVLAFRYPPMGDLAMHEALVAIMRHGGDPGWAPPGLYFLVAPQANQLFHFLAYALSFALPTDVACKVVVAAVLLATPVFMARLLARLGASRWPSLLVAPVACGWMFRWGLVANLLGFALLLASLPSLEDLARRPSSSNLARAVAACFLLFFAHESSAVAFAMAAVYFATTRAASLRGLLARSAPALITGALVAAQWLASRGLAGANMRAIGSDYGPDPFERLAILPGAVVGGYDALRTACVCSAVLVALVVSALGRRRSRRSLPLREALWHHRYAALGVVFAFLYLTFPMSLGGTTLLAHRFLAPACACIIVACSFRRAAPVRVALAALVPVVVLAIEMRSFRQTDRTVRDLDVLLARVPTGAAVAQLDLTGATAGHVAPVPGAASRALAERGGRMLFALTDMPPNPVYVPARMQWNEPMMRLARAPFAFMPAYDATRFGYLITLNGGPNLRRAVQKALEPEEELVVSAGVWDLYRSTLATVPLDAPDALLPTPAPETLADRVNHVPR